ncbi:MAG TPA: lipopolysaccharide heptosyltransferase II [Vicinamibacterales bacterium]|nr:lipopolysaccharide heptosyltransferase II [Vicinamibacterales bacterium]
MTGGVSEVRRLVVRAPNWLGDAIMCLPALGAVRQAFRGAHVTIAAIPAIAPIFQEETNAAPDAVLVIGDRKTEAQQLKAGSFDAALLFPNSFRSAWAARRAAIGERWGYAASWRRPLLTRAVRRASGRMHQSVYYTNLVRGLDLDTGAQPTPPSVSVRADTLARADALLRAHDVRPDAVAVGFAPGAAYGHAKRWPPARVAELAVRLARERHAIAILFGAAGDRSAGREIESTLPADVRVVNLIGRTDLRVLAGAVSRCSAFVANDSGAMHLAGALGVPLVAIFGPTDDRATAPLGGPSRRGRTAEPDVLTHPVFCRPCMLRECPIDHRCMTRITVDRVFAAVAARLDAQDAAR